MKKFKRIAAAVLAGVLVLSAGACMQTTDDEYPVKIAGYEFKSKPQKVLCLSDSLADVLIASGYTDSIVAKTEECDQPELDGVPSVGSRENPSFARIQTIAPDVIFADKTVNPEIIKKLDQNDYNVLNMIHAQDGKELSVLYSCVGTVMEGNKTGSANGAHKASSLLQSFDAMERAIPTAAQDEEKVKQKTVCYLYDINGTAATGETFGGKMFRYAKVLNVCASSETSIGAVESIRVSDPDYIFCAVGVKEQIIHSEKFKELTAVKKNSIYEIDADEFDRQGDTMTEVLSFIIQTVYPELQSVSEQEPTDTDTQESSQKEESKQESSKKEENEQESGKKEESKQESSKKEESKQESGKKEDSKQESSKKTESSKEESSKPLNKPPFEITDDMAYGTGEADDHVKYIQQRLKQLGYSQFKEGMTKFYGEETAKAVTEFQKKNGLDADGIAGAETLKLLFSDKAKKKS